MKRVLVRGPLDLVRQRGGEGVRAEVVTDGLVPCDGDDEIRPFARFRRSGEADGFHAPAGDMEAPAP